jgi:hypothetical protein
MSDESDWTREQLLEELRRANARAELHRLAAEELALFPDAAKWIEGPPPVPGNYWVLMWLLNPGEWAIRLVEISPAVLNPDGQLLLKMSSGAAFQYEPNKYAIARHKVVRMPQLPLDLPLRPVDPERNKRT